MVIVVYSSGLALSGMVNSPLVSDQPDREGAGGRWFVDETYVKVAGVWHYAYRAVDGYVIDTTGRRGCAVLGV